MKPVSGVRGLEPRSSHREAKGQSLLIVTVQARSRNKGAFTNGIGPRLRLALTFWPAVQ